MVFEELFKADKRLVSFTGWSVPDPDSAVSWFNAPLEISGVVQASYSLHGEYRHDLQDQNVGLELQLQMPGHRQRFSLARLDWLSIKGGHSNRRRRGHPLSGKRVPPTHYHDFVLNYEPARKRMARGDLPFATEIIQHLQSFEDMRVLAGVLFRINNIELVSRPPWEYDLFHHG